MNNHISRFKKNKMNKLKIVGVLMMLFFVTACQQEKTAYINNTELIQAYHKMKKAKAEFESRSQELANELDSLALDFQNQVKSYEAKINSMSVSQREEEENRLISLRQKIEREQQKKSNKLEQESEQVADELVKEVRKKVEKYGEEQGYTYIFGSNESANILYAKRGKDITLEVIDYINQNESTDE